LYPQLKFDHLEDVWWWKDTKEEYEPIQRTGERIRLFLESIKSRPEKSFLLVGHSGFFWGMSGVQLTNCEIRVYDLDNVEDMERIFKP
jgi:broad specificity phosphatase PhoE